VLDDVAADDPRRREYVGVDLDGLDLSAAVIRHPIRIENCRVDRLDATEATFERDLVVEDTHLGGSDLPATALVCRKAVFERSVSFADARVGGSVEFAAARVDGWCRLDGVDITGDVHFAGATLSTVRATDGSVEGTLSFDGADADRLLFDGVTPDERLALSAVEVDLLRVVPDGDLRCSLREVTVDGGRLDQPDDAVALYDLTDATVGDVALDCTAATFDRYRFYRTTFDGFPFATVRQLLRANDWRLHEYAGDPDEPADVEGLEVTYLSAKQAAARLGDGETASRFFVRELRWRRRRYAAHLVDADHAPGHRLGAGLRWLTNGFLDAVANYGERPGRVVGVSAAVVAACAATYPVLGGLATGDGTATYATDGVGALVDGLYFSVVTFATLGLGDVTPVGDLARVLAASEALAGAFLTALFVFSLGRRVAR